MSIVAQWCVVSSVRCLVVQSGANYQAARLYRFEKRVFSLTYCTLPGHVEQGEERFQLRWDFATDEVCLVTWMRFHFPTIFWLGWSSRIRDRRAGSAGSHAFQCKNRKGATRLARTNARFFALMTLLSLPSYTLANYANGRRGETSIDPKGAKKTTGLPKKKAASTISQRSF